RASSHGRACPAEHMEIGPLQRMAQEPDVDVIKGYHSYAVRTSPVTPSEDYEEEPLLEPEPPSPEPRKDAQRSGGTSLPSPQERGEMPAARVAARLETPWAKEAKQRSSPERRVVSQAKPVANKKTEARTPGRTEPKAGAKRGPAPVAAMAAEECEEGPNTIVICMVILLNIGLAILFVHFLT
ncbi:JPH2 protein, partial [Upupa epops]|nr:JPH2 protein [Upupa epops]